MSAIASTIPGAVQAPQLDGSEPWLMKYRDAARETEPLTYADIERLYGVSESLANDIMILRLMPYDRYLQSEHWQAVRRHVWQRQGGKCDLCPERIDHVHHHFYARRGFERPGDVVGLCETHHRHQHDALVRQMREDFRNTP